MNKFIVQFVIVLLLTSIMGCSQNHEAAIQGTWVANQISQVEGENIVLSHYNYWEVDDEQITLKYFYFATENGKTERRFNDSTRSYTYEWNNENKLLIADHEFEVTIKGNKMIATSKKLEIMFEREVSNNEPERQSQDEAVGGVQEVAMIPNESTHVEFEGIMTEVDTVIETQSVIPLSFTTIEDSEQQIVSMPEGEIADIVQELQLPWGKVFIYSRLDEDHSLYGAYVVDGQYYRLGPIGDNKALAKIERVQFWEHELVKLSGVYGANAPVTKYFKMTEGRLKSFLEVETGNVVELDLDEDGVAEIISQHGMFSMTMIYRWVDGEWKIANLNEALNAEAVRLDTERKLFYAHFKNGSRKNYIYTPNGLLEKEIDVQIQIPEKVHLSYSASVRNSRWTYEEPLESWKLVKSIEEVDHDGEPLTIQLFKDEQDLHAWIKYKGSTNLQMFAGYDEDETSFIPLLASVKDGQGVRVMLGCIYTESLASICLEYFTVSKEWFIHSIWGEPSVVDINDDGEEELLFRFDGKGNNVPDTTVVRWNEEVWETVSLATAIDHQIQDAYWRSIGHGLAIVPYDAEYGDPQELWFEVIVASTEQRAYYKFDNNTDMLVREALPISKYSEENDEFDPNMSPMDIFTYLQVHKERNISRQQMGKWVIAYIARLEADSREQYETAYLAERLIHDIDPRDLPEQTTLRQYIFEEIYRYAQLGHIDKVQNEALIAVIEEAEQLGLTFFTDSGIYFTNTNYAYLLEQFGDVIDDETYDYLQVMDEGNKTWFHGWVLQTSYVELAKQILHAEAFIASYPDSVHLDVVKALYNSYLRSYILLPLIYLPFEVEQATEEMHTVMAIYADTNIGRWTKEYMELWQQYVVKEQYEEMREQADLFLQRIQI